MLERLIKGLVGGLRSGLCIGVGERSIAVVRASRWRGGRGEVLGVYVFSDTGAVTPAQIATQLGILLHASGCTRRVVRFVVADAWMRSWMVTPPHNAVRFADCQAAAALRFQLLYNETPGAWRLTADWDARQPFLACALPVVLLDALVQVARDCQLVVLGMTPHFIAAWNRWHHSLDPNAWLGVVHDGVLTVGIVLAQRLRAVRATTLPGAGWQDGHWLPQHLAREALRLNVPMPSAIQLCGQVPSAAVENRGSWTISSGADDGVFDSAGRLLRCSRLGLAVAAGEIAGSGSVDLAYAQAQQ